MKHQPTISQIENAFQPAKEIDVPNRFAGRHQSVIDCYYALATQGANLAIVGNRGIGKSSLARQVIRMATGDNTLIEKSLDHRVFERHDFLAMYFACGDAVRTSDDLLESLGAERRTESGAQKAIAQHSIDTVFTNVVRELANQGLAKHGILIVVDEFDRIGDPAGFASFLKSLATNVPAVKFCLVGVAQDIKELMKEHESTDRLFAGSIVRLAAMTDDELAEIVRTAEAAIDSYLTFDHGATKRLVSDAKLFANRSALFANDAESAMIACSLL